MIKTLIAIGFLLLTAASGSYANDTERINQLEKELQETKARLSKLEAMVGNPATPQTPVVSGEGWRTLAAWRKLATGISTADVRTILGEPFRLDGGSFANWYYRNGGRVIFYEGKVYQWTEPRQ